MYHVIKGNAGLDCLIGTMVNYEYGVEIYKDGKLQKNPTEPYPQIRRGNRLYLPRFEAGIVMVGSDVDLEKFKNKVMSKLAEVKNKLNLPPRKIYCHSWYMHTITYYEPIDPEPFEWSFTKFLELKGHDYHITLFYDIYDVAKSPHNCIVDRPISYAEFKGYDMLIPRIYLSSFGNDIVSLNIHKLTFEVFKCNKHRFSRIRCPMYEAPYDKLKFMTIDNLYTGKFCVACERMLFGKMVAIPNPTLTAFAGVCYYCAHLDTIENIFPPAPFIIYTTHPDTPMDALMKKKAYVKNQDSWDLLYNLASHTEYDQDSDTYIINNKYIATKNPNNFISSRHVNIALEKNLKIVGYI